MINRVLIRIKVVQMLYSYLLTETQFNLEPQPSQPTKEKRFAYKLYIDTLALIVEIARTYGKNSKMAHNRFVEVLRNNEQLKAVLSKFSKGETFEFSSVVEQLSAEIKNSGIYKLFVKKDSDDTLIADVKVWQELFDNIILPSSEYTGVAMHYENYSLRGIDRMKELMAATFSNFMSSHGGIDEALVQLRRSLETTRQLYFRLLLLPVALVDLRMKRIEAGRNKKLPTAEDLNPDFRLTEAPLVDMIRDDAQIQTYVERNHIDWIEESPELMSNLLATVMDSEAYAAYKSESPSMHADYTFWKSFYTDLLLTNDIFLEEMESKSVFWNDDIDIMAEFAIKTLRRFEDGLGSNAVMEMYKDTSDASFAKDLFSYVIKNKDSYRSVINDCLDTKIWQWDRLALMDVIIVQCAMAEMLNFPSIPLKVTLNEYIEIAKSYSTNKSGMFVNGLLGVIIAKLQREGKLLKK